MQPTIETITRAEAVARVRAALVPLCDSERSMCKVAAKRGIFCRGFARFSEGGLRRRFAWLTRRRPDLTRAELEALANCWQLARQEVDGLPIACDVQQREHDLCNGWDDFSDEQLAAFCLDVTGEPVAIGP